MDLDFANPIFGLFFLVKVLIIAKTMFKYQKSPDQISIPEHVQKHSGATDQNLIKHNVYDSLVLFGKIISNSTMLFLSIFDTIWQIPNKSS